MESADGTSLRIGRKKEPVEDQVIIKMFTINSTTYVTDSRLPAGWPAGCAAECGLVVYPFFQTWLS